MSRYEPDINPPEPKFLGSGDITLYVERPVPTTDESELDSWVELEIEVLIDDGMAYGAYLDGHIFRLTQEETIRAEEEWCYAQDEARDFYESDAYDRHNDR